MKRNKQKRKQKKKKETKEKKEKEPYKQNTMVAATFLILKPKYFPFYSSQGTVSILYRGFGQGGSNSVLLVLF